MKTPTLRRSRDIVPGLSPIAEEPPGGGPAAATGEGDGNEGREVGQGEGQGEGFWLAAGSLLARCWPFWLALARFGLAFGSL